MKSIATFAAALILGMTALHAQDAPPMPEMPKPVKEHEWLKKLAGEWTCESECHMPGGEVSKSKGTESAKMLGDFWVVSEGKGEGMGVPFTSVFTLGYDPKTEKYVGTWVDSITGKLWTYEGTIEGDTLTLNSEGDCPMTGEHLKFRDEISFPDADTKVFTSKMSEDGKTWTEAMKMTSVRKK